tara:strand:- start:1382 stop:2386 length:1005 start_codon:yes stop_codon:yes gene_type:complete
VSIEALQAFAAVLGSLSSAKSAFDPENSGGGGGVSAKTQGGGTQLEYTPVGLETLEIPDFDYAFLDEIYQDEETQQNQQQMRYGGPLYAAGGMPIGKGFMETMAPILGNTGLIQALLANLNKKDEDEDKEESIVPGLESGGGIGDLYDPNLTVDVDLTATDLEPTTTVESLKTDLVNMLAAQEEKEAQEKRQKTFKDIMDSFDAISAAKKAFDPEKTGSTKGRGSVVPGAAAGGFRSKPNKLALETIRINPFEYKAMKGGGSVLNRGMFAQNYMPNGGDIRGPGGPKDDLIPVMASNGEFMLSKAAVDQAGGGNHSKGIAKLEQFNNLGNRRYG